MRATPKITVDTPIGADVDLEAEDVRTSTGRRLTDTVVDELVEAATEFPRRAFAVGDRAASPRTQRQARP